MTVESKSAFAARRGRSAAAVSQWIKAGLISGAALEGKGRSARIVVEIAEAQLAARVDPGQALGNGSDALKATRPLKASRPLKARTPLKSRPAKPPAEHEHDDEADEPDDEAERNPDYAREKAGLVRAQREAQEMKNALARGEQVSVADVGRHWAETLSEFKTRFLAVVGRIRRDRPNLTTDDINAIDRTIRDTLTGLSKFDPV